MRNAFIQFLQKKLLHEMVIAECTGTCSDEHVCEDGSQCVDNACCPCASEEFTLVLKNLTFDDAGRYRCQISNQPQQLEFQLEVLGSFNHSLQTYGSLKTYLWEI